MALFQSLIILLLVAALLLAASRRLGVPYPTLLALAGVGVAVVPFLPDVAIEPHLALAVFIAPALLDAAFATSPRELARLWEPLLILAVGAVLVTAGLVALAAWWIGDLPIAAALTLGAVVAPPDAAAANAVLRQVRLPRRSMLILQGESLLNDATALLLFGATTAAIAGGSIGDSAMHLAFAAPGGLLVGIAVGWIYIRTLPLFAGTLSAIVVQLTATFGSWLIADRLKLSPVLAVVAFAMLIGQLTPTRQSARDRVQSYAVWAAIVFVLNVLAFLLMGLQVRMVVSNLDLAEAVRLARIAGLVLLIVVAARFAVVFGHRFIAGRLAARSESHGWPRAIPPWRVTFLVSWCGMRGLLTLATAFALPTDFPGRALIVMTAFVVVLGTLVGQGLTLKPLMKVLHIEEDQSIADELTDTRRQLLDVGRRMAERNEEPLRSALLGRLDAAAHIVGKEDDATTATDHDSGILRVVEAQRATLHDLRRTGAIADDVFHRLEEELDWTELAARPGVELEVLET